MISINFIVNLITSRTCEKFKNINFQGCEIKIFQKKKKTELLLIYWNWYHTILNSIFNFYHTFQFSLFFSFPYIFLNFHITWYMYVYIRYRSRLPYFISKKPFLNKKIRKENIRIFSYICFQHSFRLSLSFFFFSIFCVATKSTVTIDPNHNKVTE